MNDYEIIELAAIKAQKCNEIILEPLVGKSMKNDSEFIFKFSTMCLSSLITSFSEAIINNSYPEQKKQLIKDILELSIKLSDNKESMRTKN